MGLIRDQLCAYWHKEAYKKRWICYGYFQVEKSQDFLHLKCLSFIHKWLFIVLSATNLKSRIFWLDMFSNFSDYLSMGKARVSHTQET